MHVDCFKFSVLNLDIIVNYLGKVTVSKKVR